MLNNSTYAGHLTFCVQFSHTHERRNNGARMFVPGKQVIERHDERLRIVPRELLERVKARQNHRSRVAGDKVKAGLRQIRAGGGSTGKHLLSGLLKCSECRGSYALSNKIRYQCSSHHEGGPGACDVSLSVPRTRIEGVIKRFIEDDLLNPRRLMEIAERYRAVAASEIVIDHGPRIAELETERANLIAAIKSGGLVEELGAKLKTTTAELARLKAERPKPVTLPRVMSEASFERRRAELLQRLSEGGHVAREVLREIFPDAIQLQSDESGKHLWALFMYDEGALRVSLLYNTEEERLNAQALAALAAFEANAQGIMVAGA
jgi:Recombinase zinc beta ribbon domain